MSGGTEKFTDLSLECDRVPHPWSACKSHFSTVLQVQIRNTCRASVVLPVIKLSRCSGKRKLDTGIKFLLWPTLHHPSACIHHSVSCISVHPPRKDKMAITPRNNIQILKVHLTTTSTAPLEKQKVAQQFHSFYGTWRSTMEFKKAPPPPTGPNCQINPVSKLSLWKVNVRFNIFLPSTAGLPTDFCFLSIPRITLHAFISYHIGVTCLVHIIFFILIILLTLWRRDYFFLNFSTPCI